MSTGRSWHDYLSPASDPTAVLENTVLAILVLLSIGLSSQLWFGSTLGYAVQRDPGYPLVGEATLSQVRSLVEPQGVLVHVGDKEHTRVPLDGDGRELWQAAIDLLFQDLPGHPEAIELETIGEEELLELRNTTRGIEVDLHQALPFGVWRQIWLGKEAVVGGGDTQAPAPLLETLSTLAVDRAALFVAAADKGTEPPDVHIVFRTPRGLFRYKFVQSAWRNAGVLQQKLHNVGELLRRGELVHYRPIRPSVQEWLINPDVFVPERLSEPLGLYAMNRVSIDPELLREWFFERDELVKEVEDPDGAVFLQGERQTAKANAVVRFEVSRQPADSQFRIEPLTALRLAAEAAREFNRDVQADTIYPGPTKLGTVAKEVKRGSLEDLSEGYELRSYEYEFVEHLGNYPLVSYDEDLTGVTVRVDDRGLQYFRRGFREIVWSLQKEIKINLIEPEEAVEAAVDYVQRHYDSPPKDPRIERVYLAYYVETTLENPLIAKPVWAIEFSGEELESLYVKGHRVHGRRVELVDPRQEELDDSDDSK